MGKSGPSITHLSPERQAEWSMSQAKRLIRNKRMRKRNLPGDRDDLPMWLLADPLSNKTPFASPRELWEAAQAYFEWAVANPIEEEQILAFQGRANRHTITHPRPFTMKSFAVFCGTTVGKIETVAIKDGYRDVAETIYNIMHEQKFSYAVANMMNSMLISRDLGLAEKNEVSGPGGKPLQSVVQYQLPSNGRDAVPVIAPPSSDES